MKARGIPPAPGTGGKGRQAHREHLAQEHPGRPRLPRVQGVFPGAQGLGLKSQAVMCYKHERRKVWIPASAGMT